MRLLEFLGAHRVARSQPSPQEQGMRDARLTLREVMRAKSLPAYWWTVPGAMQALAADGRLPAMAGGAAREWLAETALKWATGTNWTGGVKPGFEDDVTFTGSHLGECKLETTAGKCKSINMTGWTGILKLSVNLEVGGSTAGVGNVLIKFAGTLSGTGELVIVGKVTATAQTIGFGGKTYPGAIKIPAAGTGKFKLEEALKGSEAFRQEAGTLEGNGQEISVASFILQGGAGTVTDISGCTVKVNTTVIGEALSVPAANTFTTSVGTVAEVFGNALASEAKHVSFGGKGNLGTTKLDGVFLELESNDTHGTLILGGEGQAAGKGTLIAVGAKQKYGTLNFGGKAGSLSRLDSSSGKAELEHTGGGDYEPANSFVAVKGIKHTGGTLYLPNGKDEGENEGIVFGPKPSGVTIPLAAAASTSSAALALAAAMSLPLATAASASGSALETVATKTLVPAAAVASTSASLAVVAARELALAAAAAETAAALAVSATTTIPLVTASSTSAASLALAGTVTLPFGAATASTSASLTVVATATAVQLGMVPSASTSATSLSLAATRSLALVPASSSTTASLSFGAVVILYAGVGPATFDYSGSAVAGVLSSGAAAQAVAPAQVGGAGAGVRVVVGGAGRVGPVITGGTG